MNSARRYLSIALSFAIALAAISIFGARSAHAVAAALVQVVNTSSNPVQAADVEKQARIPYQSAVYHNDCTPGPGTCFFQFSGPPAGYRLVVENVSGYFQIDPGVTTPPTGYVEIGAPTFYVAMGITATLGPLDAGGHRQAAFNQPTKAYFDTAPFSFMSTTWSNGANTMILTGYLENCAVTGCPAITR